MVLSAVRAFAVVGGLAFGLGSHAASAQTGADSKALNDGWQLRFTMTDNVPVCSLVKLSPNGGVFGFSGGMDGDKPVIKGIALLPAWETPTGKATTVSLSFGDGKAPVTMPGETDEHMVTFDPPLDNQMDAMDSATTVHVSFDALAGDFDVAGSKAASEDWIKCVTSRGIK